MSTTHHPQHSTNRRAPHPLRQPDGIPLGDQDILDAIARIASVQSSAFVRIADLASHLHLTEADRVSFIADILRLDLGEHLVLSPLERPQDAGPWFACNALGIPCHEVALTTQRLHPAAHELRQAQAIQDADREGWTVETVVRAAADGLQTLARQRHARLLSRAAAQAQPFTVRPAPMPAA